MKDNKVCDFLIYSVGYGLNSGKPRAYLKQLSPGELINGRQKNVTS